MTWTHIKNNRELMLTEQWIFRTENAPVCALKRGDQPGDWQATILNHNGISTETKHFVASGVDDAQKRAKALIHKKGWRME